MKLARFTGIEYAIAAAVLFLLGTFALRIYFGHSIREWERSLGPERYFVIVPLFVLTLCFYWRRSTQQATELGQPVVRPWVWVTAAFALALACFGIIAS